MDLKGKSAIVTGAASGIGRATAELLANEGAKVIAADWNEARLNDAVGEMTASGAAITAFKVDVAQRADCEAMVDKAYADFGRLDVLVNNAGVMDLDQPVGSVDDVTWRRVMSINLDGPMFAMRRAVPAMLKAGGGSIVNIASVADSAAARRARPTPRPSTR